MLNLDTILKIWRRGDYQRPPVALDRHDCPEHRANYNETALPLSYFPKPREPSISVRLYYDSNGNIV